MNWLGFRTLCVPSMAVRGRAWRADGGIMSDLYGCTAGGGFRGSSEVHQRFIRGSSEVHPRFIRGSSVVHQRFIRGSSEVHQRFVKGSSEVHQRFIRGSSEVHPRFIRGLEDLVRRGAFPEQFAYMYYCDRWLVYRRIDIPTYRRTDVSTY